MTQIKTVRKQFTFKERQEIGKKSDFHCCHCGKPIRFGDNFSMDHFIPLYKGGTNGIINMIPLCIDCNSEKNQRIIPPEIYIRYIKDEYMEEIKEVYRMWKNYYITEFSDKLFFAEEFAVELQAYTNGFLKKGKNLRTKKKDMPKSDFYNDSSKMNEKLGATAVFRYKKINNIFIELPKVITFYEQYLKKNHIPFEKNESTLLLRRWFQTKDIFVGENNGEIFGLLTLEVVRDENEDYAIELFPMFLYERKRYENICNYAVYKIINDIMEENKLNYISYRIVTTKNSDFAPRSLFSHVKDIYEYYQPIDLDNNFRVFCSNKSSNLLMGEERKKEKDKTNDVLKKVYDIKHKQQSEKKHSVKKHEKYKKQQRRKKYREDTRGLKPKNYKKYKKRHRKKYGNGQASSY